MNVTRCLLDGRLWNRQSMALIISETETAVLLRQQLQDNNEWGRSSCCVSFRHAAAISYPGLTALWGSLEFLSLNLEAWSSDGSMWSRSHTHRSRVCRGKQKVEENNIHIWLPPVVHHQLWLSKIEGFSPEDDCEFISRKKWSIHGFRFLIIPKSQMRLMLNRVFRGRSAKLKASSDSSGNSDKILLILSCEDDWCQRGGGTM